MPFLIATRPLNSNANNRANNEFYKAHPELVSGGQRTPLDPCDPKQASLRQEWLQKYATAGGKVRRAQKNDVCIDRDVLLKKKQKPPAPVLPCGKNGCSAPPPPPQKKQKIPPTATCAITDLEVACEHGRKPGPTGILIVVPSSTASLGDKITGKLVTKGGCGQHPSWSVGGYWTSSGKGGSFSFNAKTWVPSAMGFLSLQNVSPHTYRVEANACAGGGLGYEVRAYPPGKVSAKFDVSGFKKTLKEGFKLLPIDEEELNQWEHKFLNGAVSYEGAWKEDEKSWKGFYEKLVQGGFDPLAAASYKGPIYPITLVPGWLEDYVAAGLFWEIQFSAKLQLGVRGKRWADEDKTHWDEYDVIGGGGGEGTISLELKLVSPDLIQGSVAGKTGLSVEAVGKKSEEVEAEVTIKFDGVKGVATLKAAWGWVELSREFQIMKEREIYKKTWNFS